MGMCETMEGGTDAKLLYTVGMCEAMEVELMTNKSIVSFPVTTDNISYFAVYLQ